MKRRSVAPGVAIALLIVGTLVLSSGASSQAADASLPVSTGVTNATLPAIVEASTAILPVTPVATVSEAPAPQADYAAALPIGDQGMKHIWQSLNNCGPAAVVMALSTFGIDVDQETARIPLRGPDVRRGMGPQGVEPWVKENWGLRSMSRGNGTNDLMRTLITNGFAPMVTQWMEDPGYSRIAHWRTVRGYDDAKGVFYVNDSMRGNHVALTYEWFSANWQAFSYRYMVIYRPKDEAKLKAIVGEDWNDIKMREHLYQRNRSDAIARNDSASWLAYGEAAYQFGMFSEAVPAFEKGLQLGSATGVFTLRNSYPQALRALSRTQEADSMQAKLAVLTPVPGTVAFEPDRMAMALYLDRAADAQPLRIARSGLPR
ncbi:MAG: C39 family peptidase [Chloroflexi bacterium]|nr:C39 family peptidase [Chloroflexota bacterium]